MAILNITPDSFYHNSQCIEESDIETRVRQIVNQGADFIDIGAYSTRPGATEVSVEEEKRRLALGLKIVRRLAPEAVVSVDTFRPEIAQFAVSQFGCDIINDISGGCDAMFRTVATLRVPYILTHNEAITAGDVTASTLQWFAEKLAILRQLGVNDIIVDPGIGFNKTENQNYELLANLRHFEVLHHPVLVGVSRKSLLYKPLGITPETALNATTALHAFCLERHAAILRVHDVPEARQCITVYNRLVHPRA